MKVFWSWQADTPGDSGRHFIRKAILLVARATTIYSKGNDERAFNHCD